MIVPQNNLEEIPIQIQAVLPKKQWIKPEMTDLTLMLGVGSMSDGEAQQAGFPGLSG